MPYNNEIRRDDRIIIRVDTDLAALLPEFLKDWGDEVRIMQVALQKKNYDTIRKMGHDMKGIGGSCGLDVISDMGSSLTKGARAMDQESIRRNLSTLSDYLERVEFVYE